MSVVVINAKIAPEHVAEVEAAARRAFAAVHAAQPEGLRYASLRLADGVSYVILLEAPDGEPNPLFELPEYQEFERGLKGWLAGRPDAGPATVVGSYRLFD
jgi:hypothetical protein